MKKINLNLGIGIVIGIILTYVIFLLLDKVDYLNVFGKYSTPEFSHIGDFLNGLSVPVIGLMSFFGILLTIIYQIRTNRFSREEQSLFELMKNQSAILNNTQIDIGSNRYKGRECYSYLYKNKFKQIYNYKLTQDRSQGNSIRIRETFDSFYTKNRYYFEHNFRSITMILKFIKTASLLNKTEKAQFLNSQMSEYELLLFFYFGLSTKSDNDLKGLICDLNFFKFFPESELLNEDHKNDYELYAYA